MAESAKIFRRTLIDDIQPYLATDDIIVLHGARQVGKTHILYYLKNRLEKANEKVYYIDLEDSRFKAVLDKGFQSFLNLLKEEGFDLRTKTYVLIDEIQYLNNPSSFLKIIGDHHKEIKLIVSGSSNFDSKSKFKNSLVGRTVNFEVFGLSFAEFLNFKKYRFSPGRAFTAKKIGELKDLFAEYALYGSYPKIVLAPEVERKEKYLQQIIDTYIRKDIRDLADIRDIDKFNKLLEALAAQSGNLLNVMELANTCRLSRITVEKYLFILENTYVIRLVRPYSRNIRSELFKTPKIFFYDSGLMQMLWLKLLPREVVGNVFETAVFSELIKKYSRENIYFWRTIDKKEIDFILRKNNRVMPIEVKLNFAQFNQTGVAYFLKQYRVDGYRVVGLRGDRKRGEYIYPWEI